MESPALVGVRAKIERAKNHFFQLDAAICSWGSSKEEEHTHRFQYDLYRKRVDVVCEKVRHADAAWPLLVGDIVHNLRSALDHLVCRLTILAGHSADWCTKTSFPICLEASKFKDSTRTLSKRKLIGPRALTLIEELQPYSTPNKTPSKNILWIISQLDIIDKHRMLVVADKHFRTKELTVTVNRGESINVPVADIWQPLEDGVTIGTIDLVDVVRNRHLILAPEYEVNVDTETELQILFDDTGCCDGMPVQYILRGCIHHVSDVVWLFGKQFFGE